MIALTADAHDLLDRYLKRMRLSLGGTSLDAKEVERDVRSHIDEALVDREQPVGPAELEAVLGRLGSPTQWVPEDEISFWRRAVATLTHGPEDWRLAYCCLALTMIGLITLPIGIGIVFLAAAFVLSRAAIALAEEREEPLGAKRWLVYPPVVFVDVLLIGLILFLPIGGLAGFASDTWPHGSDVWRMLGLDDSMTALVAAIAGAAGAWWMALAGIATLAVRPIRWLFVPLTTRFRRAHAAWLALAGLVLLVCAGAAMFLRSLGA